MIFTYDDIVSELKTRLSLLNDWSTSLFFGIYERINDMIAYATEKSAYYADFFYKEAGWITATLIDSIMPTCKILSYIPHRKIGASGNLILSADPTFSASYAYTGESVIIHKWKQFKNINGDTFVYCTEETIYYKGTVGNLEVPVAEGVYTEYIYTALGNPNEVITIYSDSIDNDNIEVFIVDSNNDILYTVNICGVDDVANELFFINDLNNYYCKIQNANDFQSVTFTFGNGTTVKQLSANTRVMIKYAATNGSEGDIASTGIIVSIQDALYDAIDNEATLYVTNNEEISNGQDIETLEEIKYNAPNLWQSGYRAGTKADWAILLENHSYIHKAKVWSNEDLASPSSLDINKIFVTAVSTDSSYLTPSQQAEVTLYMKNYKSPSEIMSWQDLKIIWLLAIINARIENVAFTTIDNLINETLDDNYGILNVDFKQNIYESDFSEKLNEIENLSFHNSELYYMEKNFNAVTSAHQLIALYNSGSASDKILLKPQTLKVYVNTYASGVTQVARDATGAGTITGMNSHIISGGVINYNTGIISFNDVYITPARFGVQNTEGTATPGTYQLSVAYQTQDGNSGQAGNIRLPYDYLITDVDSDYIITTLEYL
jgi:hypothetical protein